MSGAAAQSAPARLPPHGAGQAIGLLGGSFNPAHAAHRQISEQALKRIGLDAVWWLVSPGNPLKEHGDLAPLGERMEGARRVGHHPRIHVTDVETVLGTSRTVDLLAWLKRTCPTVRFVWLMGADNLASFHRWHRWREIAALAPIAVIDRPGSTFAAVSGPAARALARFRIDESDARRLPSCEPPAWTILHGPRSDLSSTALRRAAGSADVT